MAAMTRDEAIAFLAAGARTGKVATASPRGAPHATPVWFVVDEPSEDAPAVVFTTHEPGRKARNLAANPRAALVVDNEAFPHDFVVVHGRVSIDRAAEDLLDWSRRICTRYVPPDRVEEFARRNAVPGEWLCRMSIDRIVGQFAVAD